MNRRKMSKTINTNKLVYGLSNYQSFRQKKVNYCSEMARKAHFAYCQSKALYVSGYQPLLKVMR